MPGVQSNPLITQLDQLRRETPGCAERIHMNNAGGVDIESIRDLMDKHQPRLVAVTHIPTSSGLIQPVKTIGELCREREVLYLVDACQSVGQMPMDIADIGCDFLNASGDSPALQNRRTWLLIHHLQVRDTFPVRRRPITDIPWVTDAENPA